MFKVEVLLLLFIVCVSWSVSSNSPGAYIGGRLFNKEGLVYDSGPCRNVSGAMTCPYGDTPCILGRCYYAPPKSKIVFPKNSNYANENN